MVQPLTTSAEGQLLAIVRDLLAELGGGDAVGRLTLDSSLDRDLGLGSLERVELLMRVEREFGRRLPDQVAQSADSLADWLRALEADPAAGESARKRYDVRQPGEAPTPPADATDFASVLRGFADSHPERTQIHLFEEDRGLAISYGELYDRSAAVARGLIARGLQPGETVAIMLPTGTDFFYSFFGVMLAGGIAAPIYPPARPKQIEEYVRRQLKILGNARARFLISWERAKLVSDVFLAGLPEMRAVVSASELEAEGRASRASLPDPAEIFFLQYTSGSTGNPKGVTLTHSNVLANVRGIGWAVQARPTDRVVSWLPLYHDMGLIGSWLFSVYHGYPITVMSPLDFLSRPERWLWALSDSGGTLCPAPNFSYDLCVRKIEDAALEDVDVSPWRVAINAGEPVLPRTLQTFAERFAPYGFRSTSYVPCYGLAESSVALTFPAIDREPVIDVIDRETFEAEGRAVPAKDGDRELRFVANGQALPGHEVKVVDDAGTPVAERERGRILFRGPSRTVGYFANQEATDAVIDAEGWMDSGDLGYQADGELFVTGRLKDCIIKSGHNIIPQDVEAAASEVDGVRKGCIAAFGTVDETTGTEKMVAVVETRVADESQRRRIVEEVTAAVAEKVGMPPDHVVLVPALTVPKTSSGKIRRAETRTLYETGVLGKAKQSEPWVQMVHLWTSNFSGWVGLRLADLSALLKGTYAWLTLALPAALLGLPARLIPSRRLQSAAARVALRVTAVLNGARLEGSLDPGQEPQVWLSNRTGDLDAAALAVAVGRSALIAGPPPPGLIGFLLEPLTVNWDQLDEALQSGFDLIVVAESAAGESALRSRFRLDVFEAAARAGAALQPVSFDSDGTWPLSGSVRLSAATPVQADEDPRAARKSLREQLAAR